MYDGLKVNQISKNYDYHRIKTKKPETILKKYPDAILADVTSRQRWIKETESILSPWWNSCTIQRGLYRNLCGGYLARLKVFESAMWTSKCSIRHNEEDQTYGPSFGKPLGHRKGVHGTELLGYIEARKLIYIPTYKWVLENKVAYIIERLREASKVENHCTVGL